MTTETSQDNRDVAVRQDTLPAESPAGSMLNFIAQALDNPQIDATKLQALLDMQRAVLADEAKVAFNKALHDAQAAIPQVEKLGIVSLTRKDGSAGGSYAFSRWEDVDKVLRPIMAAHGFTLSFDMQQRTAEGGGATVTATLSHIAGHAIERSISLALDAGAGRNNLQAMGSTISYAKRYLAEMLFNIVRKGQDDDGALGGTKFVAEVEAAELRSLLTLTGTEEGRFLDMMVSGARSVEEIEEKDYVRLRNALLTKRNQQTKGKGETPA